MTAIDPAPFSAEEFRRRTEARLTAAPQRIFGDHSFNPGLEALFASIRRTPAAVLVPVVRRQPRATLLLTERTSHLAAHAGQIAFPGGKIDKSDPSPEAAALREAEEEIGLAADFVEVIGRAPDYLTGSGFHITPVLALVDPDCRLRLNRNEVEDAFEVPLAFLMDPANHRKGTRVWQGATRYFFEMPFEGRHIWGVTAGILRMLYEQLYGEPS
jgi:8-oxo-dGTP pyrophosphatase MutT (NUDIX family)